MAKKCVVETLNNEAPRKLKDRVGNVFVALNRLGLDLRDAIMGNEDGEHTVAEAINGFVDAIRDEVLTAHSRARKEAMEDVHWQLRADEVLRYAGREVTEGFIEQFEKEAKYSDVLRQEVERRNSLSDEKKAVEDILNEWVWMYLSRKPEERAYADLLSKEMLQASDRVRQFFTQLGEHLVGLDILDEYAFRQLQNRYLPQYWRDGKPDHLSVLQALNLDEGMAAPEDRPAARQGGGGSVGGRRVWQPSPQDMQRRRKREYKIVSREEYDAIPAAERDGWSIPYDVALTLGMQQDVRFIVSNGIAQESRILNTERSLKSIVENEHLSRRFASPSEAREHGFAPLKIDVLFQDAALRGRVASLYNTKIMQQLRQFMGRDQLQKMVDEGLMPESVLENGEEGNLYLYEPIANELNEFVELAHGVGGLMQRYWVRPFRFWKEMKTVWNLPTHGRNVFGNVFFLALSDRYTIAPGSASIWNGALGGATGIQQRNMWSALRDAYKSWGNRFEDPTFQAGIEIGALSPKRVLLDLGEYMRWTDEDGPGLSGWRKALERAHKDSYIAKFGSEAWGKAAKVREWMVDMYQFEDQIFRYALFKDRVEVLGETPRQAAEYIDQILPSFERLPLWARKMNSHLVPFFGFFFEAGRIMTGHARRTSLSFIRHAGRVAKLKRDFRSGALTEDAYREAMTASSQKAFSDAMPFMRAAMYYGVIQALGQLALLNADYSEEEIEMIERNTRGINVWMPWPGRPAMLNLSFLIPFADTLYPSNEDPRELPYESQYGQTMGMLEAVAGSLPMPTDHPVFKLLEDWRRNQQAFTGQPIWNETDTTTERALAVANYLRLQIAPSMLGYQMQKLIQANTGSLNASMTEPKYTIPKTLIGFTGLTFRDMNAQEASLLEYYGFSSRIRSLYADMHRIKKDIARKRIDPETGIEEIRAKAEKIKALAKEQQRLRGGKQQDE